MTRLNLLSVTDIFYSDISKIHGFSDLPNLSGQLLSLSGSLAINISAFYLSKQWSGLEGLGNRALFNNRINFLLKEKWKEQKKQVASRYSWEPTISRTST